MNHLDPADVRRDMQLLSQQARLFFGSVRDNILMGNPLATDDEIHQALVNSGALEFVRKQKMGLNYIINEGGAGPVRRAASGVITGSRPDHLSEHFVAG